MSLVSLINPLQSAFAAFEDIYSALPFSIRSFVFICGLLFGLSAISSMLKG